MIYIIYVICILFAVFSTDSHAFGSFFNKAKSTISNAASSVKNKAINVATQAKNVAGTELGKIKNQGLNEINKVKTQGLNEVNKIKAQGTNTINNIKDKASNTAEALKQQAAAKVEQTKNTAVTAANKAATDVVNKGTQAVSSVAAGLANKGIVGATGLVSKVTGSNQAAPTTESTANVEELPVENKDAAVAVETQTEVVFSEETKAKIDPIFRTGKRFINADNSNITDEDMPYIAYVLDELSKNNGLKNTILSITGNQITAAGLQVLFNALSSSPSIFQIINLSNNPLGEEGAIVIAEALGKFPTIVNLILDSCKIGDNGTLAIVKLIVDNKNNVIEGVSFANNPMITAIVALSEILKQGGHGVLRDGVNLSGIVFPSKDVALAQKNSEKIHIDSQQ